jgi:outer membrane protein
MTAHGRLVCVRCTSDVSLNVPGVSALKLNSTSIGPAAQAGFDYKIRDHWYANADVKYVVSASAKASQPRGR